MPKQRYASLIGPLFGTYYPLPDALDEMQCRIALNSSRLARLWASVYTRAEVDKQIAEWGGIILPDSLAAHLDYNYHLVEKARLNDHAHG
jgi:hypothetical protein